MKKKDLKNEDYITEEFDARILHRRVLHLCKKHNMSTAGAEEYMGFANGTLKRFDKNIPSVKRLFIIAEFFKVSTDYLLGLSNRKQQLSNIDEFQDMFEKLPEDQQKYVIGFMQGLLKFENEKMADKIRAETPLEKQRRVIRNQIDRLQEEYSGLEKQRKKYEYKK